LKMLKLGLTLSSRNTTWGARHMYRKLRELNSSSRRQAQPGRDNRAENRKHKRFVHDLDLVGGKRNAGLRGQTKTQSASVPVLRECLQSIMPEYREGVEIIECKYRSSTQFVVLIQPDEAVQPLNKIRLQIQKELANYSPLGLPRVPTLFFTSRERGMGDMERRLIELETEKMHAYKKNQASKEDESIVLTGKEQRQSNREYSEADWETSHLSPLFPITGIDHRRVTGAIMGKYRRNRSMANYLDEHSDTNASSRFDRYEVHPYEYQMDAVHKDDRKKFLERRFAQTQDNLNLTTSKEELEKYGNADTQTYDRNRKI